MKKLFVTLMVVATAAFAQAQDYAVRNEPLGTGLPLVIGNQTAVHVTDGLYFVPQYMAGYPTASAIFPRVIDVECVKTATAINCSGYNWLPQYGRAEYLFIRPRLVTPAEPAKPVIVERIILKEVPVKRKAE